MRQAWRELMCFLFDHQWEKSDGPVVPLRAKCERCGHKQNVAG